MPLAPSNLFIKRFTLLSSFVGKTKIENSILAMQWDADGSMLVRFNLNSEQDRPDILQFFPPFQPWSVLLLPNDRYVMFFDQDVNDVCHDAS